MHNCYCGSFLTFKNCCEPYLKNQKKAPTAEALMRSRYTAFAIGDADYLIQTTHISKRKFHHKKDLLDWSRSNHWIKLEIIAATKTTVTFKAYYLDSSLKAQIHSEHSTFIFENENWFYVEGKY